MCMKHLILRNIKNKEEQKASVPNRDKIVIGKRLKGSKQWFSFKLLQKDLIGKSIWSVGETIWISNRISALDVSLAWHATLL